MKISVVIVTYNRNHLLERCLSALCRLDYEGDFEVVVVINGSTDATNKVVQQYNDRYGFVKSITFTERKNIYMCKKQAVTIVTGAAVAFLDDDCVPCETWLREIKKSLLDHDVVGGPVVPFALPSYPWYWRRSMNWIIGINEEPSSDYLPLGSNQAFRVELLKKTFDLDADPLISQPYGEDNYRVGQAVLSGGVLDVNAMMVVRHEVPKSRMTVRYCVKRSIREGKCLAYWQPRSMGRYIVSFLVSPVRFILTGDLNRLFRGLVSASYIYYRFLPRKK